MADLAAATFVKNDLGLDALIGVGKNAKLRIVAGEITGGTADDYSTGGVPVTATLLGLKRIAGILSVAGEGYLCRVDSNSTAFDTFEMWEAGADGAPLDEVGDATSLDTLKFHILAVGY